MGLTETIKLILQVEDQANKVLKDNENTFKKLGDTAKQANEKASNASQSYSQKLEETKKKLPEIVEKVNEVGNSGSDSFRKLSKSQQDTITKFNMLDKETQTTLQAIHELGVESIDLIPGAQKALQELTEVDSKARTIGGSIEYAKSKVELMGTSTDSLKGKIQVVGNSVTTYLGPKWDSIKTKVTGLGSHIKTNLSNALSTVRSKIESLGNSFSGLGGIISSAIGGLGMASIGQLTVGLSLSREKMSSLNAAIMGSSSASKSLLDSIDTMTNKSVVSMDQMVNAMNKIKLSTQMSNTELSNTKEVVMKLGEASMLMGNDTETAAYQMGEAFSGLNGDFQILKENFGITKEKMKEAGWDGSAEDVKGYTDALKDCLKGLGDLGGVMDTNAGKIETVKKKFRTAGRTLGDMLTPYIGQAADAFLELEDTYPGMTQGLIGIAGGVSMFATVAPSINGVFTAVDNGMSVLKGTGELIRNVGSAIGIMSSAEELAGAAAGASAASHAAAAAAEEVEAGAAAGAAVSTWALVWPVLAVIAAIAGIALVVYEAGKAFGWWSNVGDMVGAITSGIQRLWQAFINNPDVQDFIKGLSDAWAWIAPQIEPAIQAVLKFLGVSSDGKFDVVHAIIMGVGGAFHTVADMIRAAIPYVQAAWGVLSWLVGSAISIGQGIYNALKPIVCILLGCSPGIVPALQKVQEVFSTVWNAIAGFIGGVITTIVTAIQPIIDILSQIANFYLSSFIYAWQTVIMVFNIVSTSVNMIINIFNLFLSGQINLQTMLSMIWTTLSQMFALVLSTIIYRVSSFASRLIAKAISAGRGFVSNVINFISTLPGRFGSYLTAVIYRIASAGASWVSTGITKASAMVSGIISHVQQLPGKVYTEFMNIGSRIMSAGSQLVAKAKQIGRNIVNGLLNAMGIHSPGIIQTKVVQEFVDMITGVGSKIKSAYNTAKAMGEAITDGFGNPTLEADVSNILPNTADLNTSINIQAQASPQAATVAMDSSSVDTGNAEVIGSYENLANVTGNALQQMIEKDKLAYSTIRNNDATELSNMTTNLQNKMSNMTNNVRTSMDNIVNKNKSGLNTVKNSTNTQLTSMVNKTKSANSKMIASWGVTKDGIVKAANKIKTDSTNHFNKLSKTIGSFYHKLENPGGFGAGPGTGRISTVRPMKRSGSSGFSKITDAIRKARLPYYMSLSQLKSNPFVNMDDIGSYITPTGKTNRFNTSDLIRSGSIKIPIGLEDPKNKGAGSWTSGVGKHVQKIKDKSGNWGMKGPKIIGKYATSIGFKVKEFLDGTPKINFASFKKIAEDVFSQCHYEFYYDSNKYGNWMTAFQNGGMNCSDSSDAIIAMAHAMGLPASKVHGHWNQFGHYWANVAGHKMDTTGWMNQRNWTPAASHAGPAPKSFGFNDLIEFLKSFFDGPDDKGSGGLQSDGNSNTTVISGEFTMVHDFRNLPEGISAEDVAAIVEQSATNDNFIKKLVKNVNFQNWDLNEKDRLNKKNRRAGVI